MRRINKILIGIILIGIMFLSIGYSAIQNITLDITGKASADAAPRTSAGTYLPTGFTEVEGTSLDTGLTIQDSLENKYVWVEVPKDNTVYSENTLGLDLDNITGSALTNAYTAIEEDLHTYTSDYRDGTVYTDTWYSVAPIGLTETEYNELKQKMLKSIYQNGGFYVGKYETGIEDTPRGMGSVDTAPTETPVIKQNAYPYNCVTCSQAQVLASNMPSGEYTSSLMFGVQWDLILKYLETKGATQDELKSDSTNWGNYLDNKWTISNENSKYYSKYRYDGYSWTNGPISKTSASQRIILSTGASDDFCKQGIYDLAGNIFEWTLEYTTSEESPYGERGGCYNDPGSYSANKREAGKPSYYGPYFGFRVVIY